MKQYTVTIQYVSAGLSPCTWTYSISAQSSVCATDIALEMSQRQFPDVGYRSIQSVFWDGNSAVL